MTIKLLTLEEVMNFGQEITHFIFESNKNAAYMDSYTVEDAEKKMEELQLYMQSGKAVIVGAIEDNDLLGFLWAYTYPFRDDTNRLYLSIIHVDEKYRNRKIGKQLLDRIDEYAHKIGRCAIYLHAEAFNTGAIKFYKQNGFSPERIQLVRKVKSC